MVPKTTENNSQPEANPDSAYSGLHDSNAARSRLNVAHSKLSSNTNSSSLVHMGDCSSDISGSSSLRESEESRTMIEKRIAY